VGQGLADGDQYCDIAKSPNRNIAKFPLHLDQPMEAHVNRHDQYGEIITAISPLECRLFEQRPRLHLDATGFAALKAKLGNAPYAKLFATVRASADAAAGRPCPGPDAKGDTRGIPEQLAAIAFAYRMTGEQRYLDAATQYLRTMAGWPMAKWNAGLLGGHLLYGNAVAYDWLHAELDDVTRDLVRDRLYTAGKVMFEDFALHRGWMTDAFTCNHITVALAGLATCAAAIYHEVPGIGPWCKLVNEKLRGFTAALGNDGVSQEGITYGEYYAEYLVRAADLGKQQFGVDVFKTCDWLRNWPTFQIYSAVPRKRWSTQDCLINFGDGVRYHWYGPTAMLRRLATAYRDGHAQAFVNASEADGVARTSYLDLIWHDESLTPAPVEQLPPTRHFADKDIVITRSDWRGDETVTAFKCGPHFGHHALAHYPHDIGGGHMHPDAGTLQSVHRGPRLLADDGYTWKQTDYLNTVIVNGQGQIGEGASWFEGMHLRNEQRAPRVYVQPSGGGMDYTIGDVTPAYSPATTLTRFMRHVIYLRPATWLIVDELDASEAATFEQYFHSDLPWRAEAGSFIASNEHACLRATPLPGSVTGRHFQQEMKYSGGNVTHSRQALVLTSEGRASVTLVTVLEAADAVGALPSTPTFKVAGDGRITVSVTVEGKQHDLRLRPRQANGASIVEAR
jgi:hypothetical protein